VPLPKDDTVSLRSVAFGDQRRDERAERPTGIIIFPIVCVIFPIACDLLCINTGCMSLPSARDDVGRGAIVEPSLDVAPRLPLGEVLRAGVGVSLEPIADALTTKNVCAWVTSRAHRRRVRGHRRWGVAQQYSLPFIDLTKDAPQADATAMITADAAHAFQILPVRMRANGTLVSSWAIRPSVGASCARLDASAPGASRYGATVAAQDHDRTTFPARVRPARPRAGR
jgi:hypothetical protein